MQTLTPPPAQPQASALSEAEWQAMRRQQTHGTVLKCFGVGAIGLVATVIIMVLAFIVIGHIDRDSKAAEAVFGYRTVSAERWIGYWAKQDPQGMADSCAYDQDLADKGMTRAEIIADAEAIYAEPLTAEQEAALPAAPADMPKLSDGVSNHDLAVAEIEHCLGSA